MELLSDNYFEIKRIVEKYNGLLRDGYEHNYTDYSNQIQKEQLYSQWFIFYFCDNDVRNDTWWLREYLKFPDDYIDFGHTLFKEMIDVLNNHLVGKKITFHVGKSKEHTEEIRWISPEYGTIVAKDCYSNIPIRRYLDEKEKRTIIED